MQSNYEPLETTTNLSEPQHYYYCHTDTDHHQQPAFALPNPQVLQHHHHLLNNIPNLVIKNHSEFDHQFPQQRHFQFQPWQHQHHPRRDQQQQQEAAATDGDFSWPVNCFKLGLSNQNNNCNNERVFGLHDHKITVPRFCRQTHDEEFSYSTAPREAFHWNNYAATGDISGANEKNNKVAVMTRENVNNYGNNKGVVLDERKQYMRFYGELEAIYGLAKNNYNIGEASYNQTGSSSALTGENSPVEANLLGDHPTPFRGDQEASRENKLRKKKRKRKEKVLFRSMTGFFESLVENVMSHQDRLHGQFMEAIERIDRERSKREEAWRRREAQAQDREAVARVHEQAMASTREALIVSYLEKITGQRVELPGSKKNPAVSLSRSDSIGKLSSEKLARIEKIESANRRWLGSEVEALIRIRSGLEAMFQESGSKSSVWEEVSALMASMGYQKSATRCKEKWDNIDKYFREMKNTISATKAFSYGDQLDQIYTTKSPQENDPSSSSTLNHCSKNLFDGLGAQRQSFVELLKAFTAQPSSTSTAGKLFEVSEMCSSKLNFDKVEFEDELVEEEEDNI